jgi:hypothetical protein
VCSPLLGIWAPTFSAFEIVAIFLLPFVAIHSLAGDRQSGALGIELQRPFPIGARVAIKGAILFGGWLLALSAGLLAVVLWRGYGGTIAIPELLVVLAGHALNAMMTIAIALAIAATTEHPSTAAIITLALTVGTWILDFAAAVYGGVWERAAHYTPAAFVSAFQHGLLRADLVLAALVISASAVTMATVWMRRGVPPVRRAWSAAGVTAIATALLAALTFVHASWDASETRVNSFGEAEEEALARVPAPIRVDVRLAPQDPRRAAFERGPIAKLRRVRADAQVSYLARTATGLYEQADPGYGEVEYHVGDRAFATRALTDESLVEAVVGLAGVSVADEQELPYRGHPLAVTPAGAAPLFYLIWPATTAALWWLTRRRV